MSPEPILRIVVCALAVIMALFTAPSAYFLLRNVIVSLLRLPPLWIKDISANPPEMTEDIQRADEQLQQLGFSRLGLLQVRTRMSATPVYEWQYVSREGSTYGESVQINLKLPALVQFASRFQDDSFVITRYNMGENIETPMYASHFAKHSIENAWRYHSWKIEQWAQDHGAAVPVNSVADTTQHDDIYRQKFQRLDHRRGNIISAILGVLFAWFVVLGIVGTLAILSDPRPDLAILILILEIGSMAVTAVVWFALTPRLNSQSGAVDGEMTS